MLPTNKGPTIELIVRMLGVNFGFLEDEYDGVSRLPGGIILQPKNAGGNLSKGFEGTTQLNKEKIFFDEANSTMERKKQGWKLSSSFHICEWGTCKEKFEVSDDFFAHMNNEHLLGAKKLMCLWKNCKRNRAFSAPHLLEQHMRGHTGEKPYRCKIVDEVTGCPCHHQYRLENLKTHLRAHKGEKPFVCKYCLKNFTNPSDKIKHERRTHEKVKSYCCPIACCTKNTSYTDPSSLRKHVHKEHGSHVWCFMKSMKQKHGYYQSIDLDRESIENVF